VAEGVFAKLYVGTAEPPAQPGSRRPSRPCPPGGVDHQLAVELQSAFIDALEPDVSHRTRAAGILAHAGGCL